MNENAKRWIKELQTTDKRQGRDALKRNDCFCCLGIACELFKDELGLVEEQSNNTEGASTFNSFEDSLPPVVSKHLGLTSFAHDQCICMNDKLKLSFAQIAERILASPSYYLLSDPGTESA